jgi:hypothetical protein
MEAGVMAKEGVVCSERQEKLMKTLKWMKQVVTSRLTGPPAHCDGLAPRDSCRFRLISACVTLCTLLGVVHAQPGPPTNPAFLNSWSFNDANWLSDIGNAPVAFTNLVNMTNAGDGNALLIDSTNAAYLVYHVWEPSNGPTNLTVDQGSVLVWIKPSWSSTNQGGIGPGEYSRLIEVGYYTTNATLGWWALYLSPDGSTMYFGAQTNNGSQATFLSAPVSFLSNTWYNIALTYSATNTSLYTNGVAVTNGTGVSLYPGSDVLSNGFYVGSASDGTAQFHGMIDDLSTYNYEMDAKSIFGTFDVYSVTFYGVPPPSQDRLTNAPSGSTNVPTFNAVSGQGILHLVSTNTSGCTTSSNIWITNVICSPTNSQDMKVTFTIAGGSDGLVYDVFATAALVTNAAMSQWFWQGQGYHCCTYTLTVQSNSAAFFVLGKPQDTDADGLTDAYEKLVSKTDPNKPDSSGDGMLDGWKVMWGLSTSIDNTAQTAERSNFTYGQAGWLNALSGVRTETITLDAEGNVQTSQ